MNDKKSNDNSFREQLLSQGNMNHKLQNNFHLEAKKMYTEKLKKTQRLSYVLAAGLVSLMVLFFWAFSKIFEQFQLEYDMVYIEPLRLASVWAMLLSAVLVVLSLWPAIRGKVGLRLYPKFVRFVYWILILVVTALFFAVFELIDRQTEINVSTQVAWAFTLMTLVIVMGVYMLLSGRIDRGDIQSKTKILELEYRLAELEEKLNKNQ